MKNSLCFSLLELLDLAQKIEDNGEKFYREAAKVCPKHANFLLALAEQEEGHKSFFEKIKEGIVKDNESLVYDPDGTIKSYLDAIADGLIFDMDGNLEKFVKNSDNAEELMETAIEREEDTILFFKETRNLLKNRKDQQIIDDLIAEEMTHIDWIRRQKKSLPKRHPLVQKDI